MDSAVDSALVRFGSVALVFIAYVLIGLGVLAGLARWQRISIRRAWVVGRLALNGLAALLPGLLCALCSLEQQALPAVVTALGALVLLVGTSAVGLEAARTIRDHRRALRGEALSEVLPRMRTRAARASTIADAARREDRARDVAVDAGVLVLAGHADEARRLLAEVRLPGWLDTWSAALFALDALSRGEATAHAVAALRPSDDTDTTELVTVTRALAAGLEGDWARARDELPPQRPARRISAVLYDLVTAHAAASASDHARARRALARIPTRELRERCLTMWRGPASRLDEDVGPYRG